ncbi:hypothetical protein N657DRAFT_94835 [Parathielavia appendiculata]|uniref:Uncharacterized protein n=1 Tax=Parathielavia appendiculata TaxID=2587402 RepID=A0AAN6Z1C9_9PEZI|nr:hypothetical protein N657DRAFT_94835 [Parathielavia appendiculata]
MMLPAIRFLEDESICLAWFKERAVVPSRLPRRRYHHTRSSRNFTVRGDQQSLLKMQLQSSVFLSALVAGLATAQATTDTIAITASSTTTASSSSTSLFLPGISSSSTATDSLTTTTTTLATSTALTHSTTTLTGTATATDLTLTTTTTGGTGTASSAVQESPTPSSSDSSGDDEHKDHTSEGGTKSTTNRPASSPTSLNGAAATQARSQFGVAVLALAFVAGLGL